VAEESHTTEFLVVRLDSLVALRATEAVTDRLEDRCHVDETTGLVFEHPHPSDTRLAAVGTRACQGSLRSGGQLFTFSHMSIIDCLLDIVMATVTEPQRAKPTV
jgi:hypothetical protein